MSSQTNKHGLSRHVPEDIAREIRQQCGFGCVICGASIYVYEHIDPEFAEARIHDPAAIALLCDGCHGQVTRKFWSKDKVKAARAAPRCKQTGFSWGEFDFGQSKPEIHFAGSILKNCVIPLQISTIPVFGIQGPEAVGAPFRLSANFFGSDGSQVLRIIDNSWEAIGTTTWDMEFTGGRIIIRDATRTPSLTLRAIPPTGIAVEQLHMRVGTREIFGDETKFVVNGNTFSKVIMDGCYIGISM